MKNPPTPASTLPTQASSNTRTWSDMEVQILEAARHLIADEGYHNFSMRGIASRSGIHLKSLQYYFRTKQDMLNAVVNYTIEQYYFDTYGKLFQEKAAATPMDRFSVMLDYLLDDLSNPFTAKLFPELWALSNNDTDVQAAMDIFYLRHIASLETMVWNLNPKLDAREAKERAALIGMMIEGLVLILGYGKPKHAQYHGLHNAAKSMILRMVMLSPQKQSSIIVPADRVPQKRTEPVRTAKARKLPVKRKR